MAGLDTASVTSSTALASSIATLLCGLFANLPFAIAPGMGLNAYLTFSLVLGLGMPVEQALACCMAAAMLVAALAILRALTLILNMVPDAVKLATVVGMGLLLSLIGLTSAGVVVGNKDTLVEMGDLYSLNVALLVFGLSLIAALIHHNVRGSILIGMAAVALLSFSIKGDWPKSYFSTPDFVIYKLDYSGILSMSSSSLSAILAYSLVMIFDIGGATFGLGKLAGLAGDRGVPGSTLVFVSACCGTAIGALTGTTPLIIAAESAVGIKEGGRTGLTAVVTSACFALALFFAPLIQSLPTITTTPVLVLVGAMMIGEAGHIDWTQMKTAIPAFLTIVIQPFTFSIANGIYAGLLFSFLLFFLTGDFLSVLKQLLTPKSVSLVRTSTGELQEPLINEVASPVFNRSSLVRATSIVRDYVEDLATTQPFDLTPELLLGEARHELSKSPTMSRQNHRLSVPSGDLPTTSNV